MRIRHAVFAVAEPAENIYRTHHFIHRFIAIEARNPAKNAGYLSKRQGNKSASNLPCYP
jgi:hypothetical protein